MKEALSFFVKNKVGLITSSDHSDVFRVDQFLKQCMDAMRGRCMLDHYFNGSPLEALLFIITAKIRLKPKDKFLLFVQERVREDIEWKDLFNSSTGMKKSQAAGVLRSRGLMK